MSKIWVVGATGQLGFHLGERLGDRATLIIQAQLDLSKTSGIEKYFDKVGAEPKAIVNATAYNKVDLAEKESNLCNILNVEAPKAMADWCSRHVVPFVHFSSDYVYSGRGEKPWNESDPAEPLSEYGKSKLRGERAVLSEMPSAVIFRTSWVYSHRRENFVLSILKNAREKGEVTVVTDLIGHPTYADGLAENVVKILSHPEFVTQEAGGVYHLCDDGAVSRFDFARAILEEAAEFEPELKKVALKPAKNSDFKAPAARPANTRLSLEKVRRTFGVQPVPWRENLRLCLRRYYASRR